LTFVPQDHAIGGGVRAVRSAKTSRFWISLLHEAFSNLYVT
jgi:hypothetical protein